MVTLELTEEDAEGFVEYRKHQDTFLTLFHSGVFNLRSGKAILNFNHEGALTDIDCNINSYKIGKPIINVVTILQKKMDVI